jgi:hypothetical protein
MPKPEPERTETHYVLLADACPDAWREALVPYLSAYRATSGQSLRDAFCLAGKPHHITLVGSAVSQYGVPHQVEAQIREQLPEAMIDRMRVASVRGLRRLVARRIERNDRYGDRDEPPVPPRPRWRRTLG